MLIKMEMNAAGSFEELAVKLIVVIRKIVKSSWVYQI